MLFNKYKTNIFQTIKLVKGWMQGKVSFAENIEYFSEKLADLRDMGISILGGCCGTNPDYIKKAVSVLETAADSSKQKVVKIQKTEKTVSKPEPENREKWFEKEKKLIAVELSPPPMAHDEKLMEAAHLLQKYDVDVVTFPDSPSGRTRADSILVAEKVARIELQKSLKFLQL